MWGIRGQALQLTQKSPYNVYTYQIISTLSSVYTASLVAPLEAKWEIFWSENLRAKLPFRATWLESWDVCFPTDPNQEAVLCQISYTGLAGRAGSFRSLFKQKNSSVVSQARAIYVTSKLNRVFSYTIGLSIFPFSIFNFVLYYFLKNEFVCVAYGLATWKVCFNPSLSSKLCFRSFDCNSFI